VPVEMYIGHLNWILKTDWQSHRDRLAARDAAE
jgi:hypothetical protein